MALLWWAVGDWMYVISVYENSCWGGSLFFWEALFMVEEEEVQERDDEIERTVGLRGGED